MKFQLYYPLKNTFISQDFGSKALLNYYKENGLILPGHNGIDYVVPHGTPIYAAHAGTAYYEIDGKQGHGVVIRTDEEYEYGATTCHFKSIYWHLCDYTKEPQFRSPLVGTTPTNGKKVAVGELIGYINTTGLSTGDHLHFGIKPCALGEPHNTWYNLEQSNGMFGAIDPNPYFIGKYAVDYISPTIKPIYTFVKPIYIGSQNQDVLMLQKCLQSLGFFPRDIIPTGYYGVVTKTAVYDFQMTYVATNWMRLVQVWANRGNAVLSLTKEELNKLFSA
jgi:hypothetical protein